MSTSGWIGVDLDGTLAEYGGWKGAGHIGAPVPAMLERVKAWISDGVEVRIFTARVSDNDPETRIAIAQWCHEHVGQVLKVTNQKDYAMVELWDDRAVQVELNTGRPIGYSTRGNTPKRSVGVVISCNRHEDCARAPKGQLCCFDETCTRMECQVRR